MAVITALMAYIAWRSTSSLRLSERAYLAVKVDGFKLKPAHAGHQELEVFATAYNAGKTPCVLTKMRGCLFYSEIPPHYLVTTQDSDRTIPEGLVVFGDTALNYPTKKIFTNAEIEAAERFDAAICFVGEFQYEDIFGSYRTISFCYRFQKGYTTEWRFKFAGDSELNRMS